MDTHNDFPTALRFAIYSGIVCIIAFVFVFLLGENANIIFKMHCAIGVVLNLFVIAPLIKVGTLDHMGVEGFRVSSRVAGPTLFIPLIAYLFYACMVFNPDNIRHPGNWQLEWLATCGGINIFVDFCYWLYCAYKYGSVADPVSS